MLIIGDCNPTSKKHWKENLQVRMSVNNGLIVTLGEDPDAIIYKETLSKENHLTKRGKQNLYDLFDAYPPDSVERQRLVDGEWVEDEGE